MIQYKNFCIFAVIFIFFAYTLLVVYGNEGFSPYSASIAVNASRRGQSQTSMAPLIIGLSIAGGFLLLCLIIIVYNKYKN